MTDEAFDEFSFLAAQQRDLALNSPLPRAERLSLTLDDGRTLSALRYGDAPPAVTFLHGAGLNAHTWDATILAAGLPALAIDLPGHGDSSWREDAAYIGSILAPDVITAMSAWTEEPQLLVGHSLGGLTAMTVAGSHPELVRALVIVDITPGVKPTGAPRELLEFYAGPTDWASREELVDRAMAFGLGGSRDATARGVFLNSRVREDGRVEWKHHIAHLMAAATAASTGVPGDGENAMTTALRPDTWLDLERVSAPITLVHADNGYLTDDDVEEFVSHAPTTRVEHVTSSHNVQEQIPRKLAELLTDL
ncbi:pimeloyl-ACP methyl ester carboxylesterase [Microbacterium endophyticum]|uniref:Pimeloyl-ACP methyl ester carboxylesterase n=1 Tax=Microbacterium endophyticum TaxID=1526412 RepID=A0A7W4YMJ6_9MICO|nr:alpha/beta hydrolase [Microbacterium endophyticum]MBB2976268.1 pimeloyl-ACP methyl ester carboxylesterase [Microbacterium endophyticum]NIK35148.1 pimeloyl-ACP methyl ester carboxylesterase [Microbacterium endophyticum]